jgi:aspartyl-tRNA(Asn)/glutamyl-tRNA(Gln) amidotransferase subunit B
LANQEAEKIFSMTLRELQLLMEEVSRESIQKVANYITSDLVGYIAKQSNMTLTDASPTQLAKLLRMLILGKISSRSTKDLLPEVVFSTIDPEVLAGERGLAQRDSKEELMPTINKVLMEHAPVVAKYVSGNKSSLQFLIGQCMKETHGSANPVILKELLIDEIARIS